MRSAENLSISICVDSPMGREKSMVCPRCGENVLKSPIGRNAISQEDDKTKICSSCGVNETRMGFFKIKGMHDRIPKEQLEMTKKFREKLGLPKTERESKGK